MSQIKSVTVGGVQYNIAQAPAVEQKKLLSLVSAGITDLSTNTDGEIETRHLFLLLSMTSVEKVDQIAAITLKKTVAMGGDKPVDVADFQGRMVEYYQLIAEAIRANLEDFFVFLASIKAEAAGSQAKGQ